VEPARAIAEPGVAEICSILSSDSAKKLTGERKNGREDC